MSMRKQFGDRHELEKPKGLAGTKQATSLIRIIGLPGIQSIEDKILIQAPRHGELPWQLNALIDDVSQQTFGITMSDTLFAYPVGYDDLREESEAWWEIFDLRNEHEEQFETSNVTDDEAVQVLSKFGFDFQDAEGIPLRCTKFFCRQAEAAAKGIMGRMPDLCAADIASWERTMKRDVAQYNARKRTRS